MKKTLILCFVFFQLASSQQRYLVNQYGDAIPIGKGQSGKEIFKRAQGISLPFSLQTGCTGQATFGYPPDKFPITTGNFGFNKDIFGMTFTAPATGSIDSVLWVTNGLCAGSESTMVLRILRSNVYPGHSPGFEGYPPPSSSTCWGYYLSTQDLVSGIAAFPEDATGPWQSTVQGSPNPSFPPADTSIWGFAGVPIQHLKPAEVRSVPMDILPGGLQIHNGDQFMITLRIQGAVDSLNDYPCGTGGATNTSISAHANPETLKTRNWKFYERVVTFQSGFACKGWVARGDFDLSIWYIMTATSNIPPTISSVENIQNTLSTGPQTLSATIIDCDPSSPDSAGVASAYVRYQVSPSPGAAFGSEQTISMSNIFGDSWEATLPGQPRGATVSYRIVAFDNPGLGDSIAASTYKVIDLNSSAYRADTSLGCTPVSIHSAAAIDTSAWFLPGTSTNTHAGDDGTSGPYSLGGPFVFYGDTMNYAWIGVNGAIALSKTATDTVHVNAAGFGTATWDIPQRQNHGVTDTANFSRIPKAFIAPFWADWIVKQDSPFATFGKIRYSSAGNTFIAEWDSAGDFQTDGAVADIDVFRVILNRTTGVIQFQYDEVGAGGLDTNNLVGIQCDSNYHPVAAGLFPPFNYFNRNGYPLETRVHNGLCVQYYPVVYQSAAPDGWGLVSVGSIPPNYAVKYLFPTAISKAFGYKGGYYSTDTLRNGPGYWIKLLGAQMLSGVGTPLTTVTDTLYDGWSLIGSVSTSVPTSAFVTTPSGLTAGSPFYGYATGSYSIASTIDPGQGYWVRSTGAGHYTISSLAASEAKEWPLADVAGFNHISLQDGAHHEQSLYIGAAADEAQAAAMAYKYEMPPRGPEGSFDARFTSGRMVETYPAGKLTGELSYPLQIQSGSAVKISWSINGNSMGNKQLVLASQEGKVLGVLNGRGSISVDASTKPVIKVTEGVPMPKAFALSRNYPNPFNPVTHFTVEVPKAAVVEVVIFDILGRKIATLMNGEQEVGYHLMEWNAKDSEGMTVPSGMYFVRMSARDDQFSAVQKIMLLK